jgi:glycosyltransferase involved in cell wall biosynthesis
VKRQCFTVIPWEAVEDIFYAMSSGSHEAKAIPECSSIKPTTEGDLAVRRVVRSLFRKAIYALPFRLRKIVFTQIEVFIGLADLVRVLAIWLTSSIHRQQRPKNSATSVLSASAVVESPENTNCFEIIARPGDILASFGSPWIKLNYNFYTEKAVRTRGLRFALLIYDVIPLRRPEWCDAGLTSVFQAWLDVALPMADTILTISMASAGEVAEYARNANLTLRATPLPIPIGTGFKKSDAVWQNSPGSIVLNRLPVPNSYVLMVSTIEARKNHVLLFRVWRRLLADMPAGAVPTLVFAGRVGWLASDLMQQLRNSGFLNGKIIHIDSPTDEELEALYEGCLFTLYPSFYEGWGLPVAESHAFGRPCIISKATSLPEAGGSLARYIDPDNATEAYQVIRKTIEDQAGLREWRDQVQRDFRPTEWSESACAVLKALDVVEHDQQLEKGTAPACMSGVVVVSTTAS